MAESEIEIAKKLVNLLDSFGNNLVDDLIESLRRNGVTGSGGQDSNLAGSIRFLFINKPGTKGISIEMNDYWEDLEKGRNPGKMPLIRKIVEWIKWKGMIPKLSDRTKKVAAGLKNKTVRKSFKQASTEAKIKSLAFAIATAIGKKGTIKRFGYGGSNFASEVFNDGRIDELQKRVQDLLGMEIEIKLSEALTQK